MKKVVFITLNLGKGGAEKVFTTLVKNLHTTFDITVVSIHGGGYYEQDIINTGVNYYTLKGPAGNTLLYVFRLRKILRKIKPEVLVSFLWYPNIISGMANLFSSTSLIVSERSNHRIYLNSDTKKKLLWKPLLRLVYKRANLIIPNSKKMGENIIEDFKLNKNKIKTIHNGIDFNQIDKLVSEPVNDFKFESEKKYLISVGRLNEPKNYQYLLRAFYLLIKKINNVELLILGDGNLKSDLINITEKLNIKEKVHFVGFKSNPYKYLKKANCYVMSSKREGFPNALIEGLYVTGKVVSTNCQTGPDEIITDGKDGYLVSLDNTEEMAEAIYKIISDSKIATKFYEAGREKVKLFNKDFMIESFKNIIDEVGH